MIGCLWSAPSRTGREAWNLPKIRRTVNGFWITMGRAETIGCLDRLRPGYTEENKRKGKGTAAGSPVDPAEVPFLFDKGGRWG